MVPYTPERHALCTVEKVTLISISHLTTAGYAALFCSQSCSIYTAQKRLISTITLVNGLYCIHNQYPIPFTGATKAEQELTMEELHAHLSHIGTTMICDMLAKGMVTGVNLHPSHTTMGQCEACEYGKATRKPIGKDHELKHCEKFRDEVHTNVWGPLPMQTPAKKMYYVMFTDNHTQYMHLYLMVAKSDTFNAYRQYEAWAENQCSASIKRLRSDCGGEYLSDEFTHHLKAQGTERKLTTHDTPQHNGVVERLNHMLVEQLHVVLHPSGLPKTLWGKAVSHIIWVKNRSVTQALDARRHTRC